MTSLPQATVTFLFTDVEGSTRLLQEHGDRYVDLLAEHRRVLRNAFTRHGGVEVDTQGDAFFIAFAKATDALSADLGFAVGVAACLQVASRLALDEGDGNTAAALLARADGLNDASEWRAREPRLCCWPNNPGTRFASASRRRNLDVFGRPSRSAISARPWST
jgi:class 3 adenylate cyclase